VYPNHIVFWNAGRLPEDWTTTRLFEKHPSKPYNPSIANTLFRCGDIESWGRGYKRIMDAMASYKLLPPIIEIVSGLMITYYTDVHSQLKAQKIDEKFYPIIEFVAKNGSITNTDVQKLMNTSKTTAYRLLTQLDEWLDTHGITGKGTYYTFKGFKKGSK
jgi:ATP-dependent DNA helicase RecG